MNEKALIADLLEALKLSQKHVECYDVEKHHAGKCNCQGIKAAISKAEIGRHK